jgi:hypothetical protein
MKYHNRYRTIECIRQTLAFAFEKEGANCLLYTAQRPYTLGMVRLFLRCAKVAYYEDSDNAFLFPNGSVVHVTEPQPPPPMVPFYEQ